MRPIIIALSLLAAPLAACATSPSTNASVSPAAQRQMMQQVEDAYRAAYDAYAAAERKGTWSPAERDKALTALGVAYTGVQATRAAFETDGAPTFVTQATQARKLAEAARAAIPA